MRIAARIVIPGLIEAFDLPIIPGETGSLCERCDRWHWHVDLRPAGWRPEHDIGRFVDYVFSPSFFEYSRCDRPADSLPLDVLRALRGEQ